MKEVKIHLQEQKIDKLSSYKLFLESAEGTMTVDLTREKFSELKTYYELHSVVEYPIRAEVRKYTLRKS